MVDCIRILFQIVGFTFLKVLNTVGTCPARLFAMLLKTAKLWTIENKLVLKQKSPE